MEEISIRPLTQADEEEAMIHLKEIYMKDEPILNFLNVSDMLYFDKFFRKLLRISISLKAVNGDEKIVGLLINRIVSKENPYQISESDWKQQDEKFRNYCAIDDYVDAAFHIFDAYPKINGFFEATILSVDRKYRSIGIARKLIEKLPELATKNDLKLILAHCTNIFTYRLCSNLGYHHVAELPYKNFKTDTLHGLPISEPHTIFYIVVKEL